VPLQNRVTPFGEIVAVAARGTLTGNRGVLHDAEQRIVRDWQVRRWIACRLEFRGRWRPVMPPGRWTALFFLDEATALAAGHRPCAECRHADYQRFRTAWSIAHAWPPAPAAEPPSAGSEASWPARQPSSASAPRPSPTSAPSPTPAPPAPPTPSSAVPGGSLSAPAWLPGPAPSSSASVPSPLAEPALPVSQSSFAATPSASRPSWSSWSIEAIDRQLHAERRHGPWRPRTHQAELASLPDGAFIAADGAAWLVHHDALLRWTPAGYTARRPRTEGAVTLLTPPSLVAVLAAGYTPAPHPSAS
jgi:hypothetical protein